MPISGGRPERLKYMFIDGAYLDERLKALEPVFGEVPAIDYERLGYSATKVFYYDALPREPEPNAAPRDQAAYELKLAKKQSHFDMLRSLPGWHVVQGVVKRGDEKKAKAQQKEVDILIAVDMLTHTYRRNMEEVIFLAGDLDFRPLVDAVVRDGMYVTLQYDPASVAKDLVETADTADPLRFLRWHSLLRDDLRARFPKITPQIKSTNDSQPEGAGRGRVGWIGTRRAPVPQGLRCDASIHHRIS